MTAGLAALVLGYLLSQFYRACLAVLAPILGAEIGAGPDDLALSSGLWFIAFAAVQLPVGWALDRFGPRRTAAAMLGVGGAGGAAIMAMATGPWGIHLGMSVIGIGCAPVLMASFYIFGRMYPPAAFATLAGLVIGLGTLGNILSAWPLAFAAEAMGWRGAMWAMAAITLGVALAVLQLVPDPPRVETPDGGDGGLRDILRIPAIWFILPLLFVNYAPAAGLRGLWAGPYLSDVFGAGPVGIGQVTLVMALAMIAGSLAYGPLDRRIGRRKALVLVGNTLGLACLVALWAFPLSGFWTVAVLMAGVGLFGASFPVLMAHGSSFFPPHLLGRGVTLLNLFGIGGVGVLQMISARVHAAAPDTTPEAPYQALFAFFAVMLLIGIVAYAFSRERPN